MTAPPSPAASTSTTNAIRGASPPVNGDGHADAEQHHHRQPPTKRRRIGYACDLCRAKKNRCDGERPTCGSCFARRQECVYSPHRTRISVTHEYVDSLRARNRALEELLASQQIGEPESPSFASSPFAKELPSASWETPGPASLADAMPRQSQYQNGRSPEPIVSGNMDTEEGRIITSTQPLHRHQLDRALPERRPSLATSIDQNQGYPDGPNHEQPLLKNANTRSPSEYFGQSSTFDFIARVGSPNNARAPPAAAAATATPISTAPAAAADTSTPTLSAARPTTSSSYHGSSVGIARTAQNLGVESLAASSPSTVVFEELLGSGGLIGTLGGGSSGSNPFELPQRGLADQLVASFFGHRHPLNPYLHEGTFRRRYELLWLGQDAGGEDPTTPANMVWLGLVNLVFAFGSEHVAIRGYGRSAGGGSHLDRGRTRFFERAKTLVLSGILQAGKIELVQALLLMSHYLHGSLELNHCWTMVGLAVRSAQELGLYMDPAQFTADIVEQEVRKRVWWGCFALDRLISTKVGRPPVIHDGPAIRACLPLPVDDEFLNEASGYKQPTHIPSKLEFFNHIIGQCRLVEKVLETLYSGGGNSSVASGDTKETRIRLTAYLPDLLARSIQLDGALVTWQEALPQHLRPDSTAPEWHFQRQRSVLLMRFLHTRLLIHRQTLLFYISRRISDSFQLDVVRRCIRRCVTAAVESTTQVRLLRQQGSLSSFWHNSHYVFASLGVLLVYQKLDFQSRADIGVPSLALDDVISQGLESLQHVGGEMHPLASRYVRSFQQLQTRLQTIPALSVNAPPPTGRGSRPVSTRPSSAAPGMLPPRPGGTVGIEQGSGSGDSLLLSREGSTSGASAILREDSQQQQSDVVDSGAAVMSEPLLGGQSGTEYLDDALSPGFDDDFAFLQSVLLDSGEWPVFPVADSQQV